MPEQPMAEKNAPYSNEYAEIAQVIDAQDHAAELQRTKIDDLLFKLNDPSSPFRNHLQAVLTIDGLTFSEKASRIQDINNLLTTDIPQLEAERDQILAGLDSIENELAAVGYVDLKDPKKAVQARGQGGQQGQAQQAAGPGATPAVGEPLHQEGHKQNLEGKVDLLFENLRTWRNELRDVDRAKNQLTLALERVNEIKEFDVKKILDDLEKLHKADFEKIKKRDPDWHRTLEQSVGRYVDPRLALGAVLSLIGTLAPGTKLAMDIARVPLSMLGGVIGGDAIAQGQIQTNAVQFFKDIEQQQNPNIAPQPQQPPQNGLAALWNRLQQPNQPANSVIEQHNVNQIADLIANYLETAANPQEAQARMQMIMEQYSKMTYIASVKGMEIDGVLAANDRAKRTKNLNNPFVKAAHFLTGGDNKWARIGVAGVVAASSAALTIGTGGVGGILGGLAVNSIYTLLKTGPNTLSKKAYDYSSLVEGIQQGLSQYIESHPGDYAGVEAAYTRTDEYREDARKYRRNWAVWSGLAMGAVSGVMMGVRHGWFSHHEQPATHPVQPKNATQAAAATEAKSAIAPDHNAAGGIEKFDKDGGMPMAGHETAPIVPGEPHPEQLGPETLHLQHNLPNGNLLHYEIKSPDGHAASYNLAKEVVKGHIEQVQANHSLPHDPALEKLYNQPFNEKDPLTQHAIKDLEQHWKDQHFFTKDGALDRQFLADHHIDFTHHQAGGIDAHADANQALEQAHKEVPNIAQTTTEAANQAAHTPLNTPFDQAPTPEADKFNALGSHLFGDFKDYHPPLDGLQTQSPDLLHSLATPSSTHTVHQLQGAMGNPAETLHQTPAPPAAEAARVVNQPTSSSNVVDASHVFAQHAATLDTAHLANTANAHETAATLTTFNTTPENTHLAQARALFEKVGSDEKVLKGSSDMSDFTKKDINDKLITFITKPKAEVGNMELAERVNALRAAVSDHQSGGVLDNLLFAGPEKKALNASGLSAVLDKPGYREAILARLSALIQKPELLKPTETLQQAA